MTTDKLGRRTILLPCQTLLVVILFTVGGLNYSGATNTGATANAAAGTALVSPPSGTTTQEHHDTGALLTQPACHLLPLDVLVPGHCHVTIRLLRRASLGSLKE
jgi:hypothetical protein